MTPAASAQRLLLGTGLGLLLASGLGFISGILSIENPGPGFGIPILGLLILVLSGPTGRGEGILGNVFPNEDRQALSTRIEGELVQSKGDNDIGDAWARLEHTVLSKELEEE